MTTDNLIIIKGGSYDNIKKALLQWVELYSENLDTNLTFELYKNGRESHIIKADGRLDNERFNYLVNYLYYPEGIEYKIQIEGFTTEYNHKELLNKKLLVFISDNDTEADNVYAVTADNETFKIDFSGRIIRVNSSKTYRIPYINQLSNPEIIKSNKKEAYQKRQEKSQNNPKKRFRIISIITLSLTIVSLLALFKDTETFFHATLCIGMGLGLWFFIDYKMLQDSRYYLYSFSIAITFLGYGILIQKQFPNLKLDPVELGSLYPIWLLTLQIILRLTFKQLFNREPVVEKPIPTFWDGVYTLMLFTGFTSLPFILYH